MPQPGGAPDQQLCQYYEGENVTIKRDWKGHLKHVERNRDFRRAHLMGAIRRVEAGKAAPENFGTRMKNALLRFLAA